VSPLQAADVRALSRRPRLDHAPPCRDLGLSVRRRARYLHAAMTDESVEVPRPDLLATCNTRIKLLEDTACDFAGGLGARQDDDIAMGVRFDAEAVLDQRQMGIVLAEQLGKVTIVLKGDDQTLLCSGSPGRLPSPGSGCPTVCVQYAISPV